MILKIITTVCWFKNVLGANYNLNSGANWKKKWNTLVNGAPPCVLFFIIIDEVNKYPSLQRAYTKKVKAVFLDSPDFESLNVTKVEAVIL